MVISNRERYIAIGVGIVLGLLVLDQMVLGPYLAKCEALKKQDAAALEELNKNEALKTRRRNLMDSWNAMVTAGMKTDPAEAQNQLDRAVRDWELQAGLAPDQYTRAPSPAPEKGFQKTKAHLVANGSMRSVSSFLWSLEVTLLPVRIDDVTITSTKEGTDALKVEMDISLLVPVGDQQKPRTTVADARGF